MSESVNSEALKRTVLYESHKAAGAKTVPFAGWDMPIQYGRGPLEEHRLVRRSAGLFDVSHMGRLEVSGPGSLEFLDGLVTSRLEDMAVGEARYGLLCREDGGVLDDLFLYRLEGRWLVVVNASNREKDYAWIKGRAPAAVKVEDVSPACAMLALQGPRALELFGRFTGVSVESFPERFRSAVFSALGVSILAGRTGYTGEDGFELFPPADKAAAVWDGLLAAAAAAGIEAGPIGLAARDSLRFEPGFALYGHELSEEVTPVEAGLLWACDLEKPFTGRDAIKSRKDAGPKEKLVTFVMTDRAVPREGYPIEDESGSPAGRTASGMYAPTADKFAGNAFVRPDLAATGKIFYLRIRDARKAAVVVKRPLYVPAYRKSK